MSQLELSMKPPMQELDVATVSKQPTLTGSLILCQTLSGLEDKELCGKGGVINEAATWSRIKNGANNFPQDNLIKFMDLCGNEAPLIWLADRRGYQLTPKETEWERQARLEREGRMKAEEENRLLRSLLMGKAA
jgi:hypothetical protein